MATPQIQFEDVPTSGIVGPFAEELLHQLSKVLEFDGFTIRPESIELGEDVFNQTVTVDFGVSSSAIMHSFGNGPVLTFSFSPGVSIADNINEFKEFVRGHAEVAAKPPSTRFSEQIARLRPLQPPERRGNNER